MNKFIKLLLIIILIPFVIIALAFCIFAFHVFTGNV